MITTKIEYYIKHGELSYMVTFDTATGITMLLQWERDKEMFVHRFDASFVCDDRKAAEIFCQAFINHEKRKA